MENQESAPLQPEEYIEYLRSRLNTMEKALDKTSGLDERVDYTNMLLTRMAENFGVSPVGAPVWMSSLGGSLEALTATVRALEEKLKSIPSLSLQNPNMIATKRTLVLIAGTAVQLPSFRILYDRYILIKSISDNTDTVYIGNSKVEVEDAAFRYPLEPGENIQYKIRNVSQIWLDAAVSGEGINWTVEQNEVVDNG